MPAKYKNTSNYRNTKQVDDYLDLYEPPLNLESIELTTIKVSSKYHNRPDLLAYDLYREPSLWWVFVLFNRDKIVDPLFDIVSGMEISVPKNISTLGI